MPKQNKKGKNREKRVFEILDCAPCWAEERDKYSSMSQKDLDEYDESISFWTDLLCETQKKGNKEEVAQFRRDLQREKEAKRSLYQFLKKSNKVTREHYSLEEVII